MKSNGSASTVFVTEDNKRVGYVYDSASLRLALPFLGRIRSVTDGAYYWLEDQDEWRDNEATTGKLD